MTTSRYEFDALPFTQSIATLTIRKTTMVDVFLRFVTQSLVERMISAVPLERWVASSVSRHYIPHKISDMYKYMAVTILLQGDQGNVTSSQTGKKSQIVGVKMACEYFNNFPQKLPGVSLVDAAMSRLLINSDMEEELSLNFQKVIQNIGQIACADEKLYHFTGQSGYIKQVLNKPARIGHWFYQLTTSFSSGRIYLMYVKIHNSISGVSTIPVSSVVNDWIKVVHRAGIVDVDFNPNTVLVFDSYYTSLDSINLLREAVPKVPWVGGVNRQRFQTMADTLEEKVAKPGHWVGMYNTEHQECFVYYWTLASSGEKKFVTGNCYLERAKSTREATTSTIPLYDLYAASYGFCDQFNKSLSGCMYPYKRGGKNYPGYTGNISDFYFTCILKNTFAIFQELSPHGSPELNFGEMCLKLANELYDYSCSLTI